MLRESHQTKQSFKLGFLFEVWALLAAWSSLLMWSYFEFKFSGMMTVLRLLLLCTVLPLSTSIKCFSCIGSVSIESCLWTRSQRDRFPVHLPQAAHMLEHPRWERERMPPRCQLLRTQVQFSLLLLDRKLSITFIRLRIRNQNKYYHNRGRADGLSGWPQNYEVNFRGCGTPYQTRGKTLIQMCCNLTNCLPSGDAYNNNLEFREVSEIVLTTQPDWPLSDCWEHKRPKVQRRRPRWSDPVEVGVLYTPGWSTCLI